MSFLLLLSAMGLSLDGSLNCTTASLLCNTQWYISNGTDLALVLYEKSGIL